MAVSAVLLTILYTTPPTQTSITYVLRSVLTIQQRRLALKMELVVPFQLNVSTFLHFPGYLGSRPYDSKNWPCVSHSELVCTLSVSRASISIFPSFFITSSGLFGPIHTSPRGGGGGGSHLLPYYPIICY